MIPRHRKALICAAYDFCRPSVGLLGVVIWAGRERERETKWA